MIEITPDLRLVGSYDVGTEDPRSWTPKVDALVYNGNDGAEDLGDCATILGCVFAIVWGNTGDDAKALKVAQRYKRFFAVDEEIETFSIRGPVQSAWWEVVVVTPAEHGTPQSHAKTLEAWLTGDVWVVDLQRRATWRRTTGLIGEIGQEMHTWETEESLSGCYLDQSYNEAAVAFEHWTSEMDDDEIAALRALLPTASPLASEAVTP